MAKDKLGELRRWEADESEFPEEDEIVTNIKGIAKQVKWAGANSTVNLNMLAKNKLRICEFCEMMLMNAWCLVNVMSPDFCQIYSHKEDLKEVLGKEPENKRKHCN